MSSSYGKSVPMILVGGALLIACYFISPNKSKSKVTVPGLENMRNACFLNALLQALASVDVFVEYLQSSSSSITPFSRELLVCLEDLQVGRSAVSGPLKASRIFDMLQTKHNGFNGMYQQDAEEAFQHLMDSLDREMKLAAMVRKESSSGLTLAAPSVTSPNPFLGKLMDTVCCAQCGYAHPPRSPDFLDLSLAIVADGFDGGYYGAAPDTSLKECLVQLTAPEELENVECRQCMVLAKIVRVNKHIAKLKAQQQQQQEQEQGSDMRSSGDREQQQQQQQRRLKRKESRLNAVLMQLMTDPEASIGETEEDPADKQQQQKQQQQQQQYMQPPHMQQQKWGGGGHLTPT